MPIRRAWRVARRSPPPPLSVVEAGVDRDCDARRARPRRTLTAARRDTEYWQDRGLRLCQHLLHHAEVVADTGHSASSSPAEKRQAMCRLMDDKSRSNGMQ